MTTRLEKPLSREVMLAGEPYKVTISSNGICINEKGHRKGVELSWDTLLKLSDEPEPHTEGRSASDVPRAIASDVAGQIQTATAALSRAANILAKSGGIPASLLSEIAPDRTYGRPEQRDDWFVEPLLTADEVASVLRISRRSVSYLNIPQLRTAGGLRFRQSEVRRYITENEEKPRDY